MTTPRIDHLVTSGRFSLDGQTFDVDNNVWILGDNEECVVIDAPHDAPAIVAGLGGRRLRAVLCTHAHDDHVRAAPQLAALAAGAAGAPGAPTGRARSPAGRRDESVPVPILLHPADLPLWRLTHPDLAPDGALSDGEVISLAGTDVHVLHTPGHSPGSVCFYVPALDTVFTGDTLFAGGPGATGRSFSDFGQIIASIQERLLSLPPETVVRTGHGDTTTVGDEAPHLQEWIDRRH